MLTRGTPPTLDPTEIVEYTTLPLFEATLLTENLRSHGLEASCDEAFNIATRTSANGRVLLPRGQLDEARRVDTAN